ncbi:MAG: CBS domain-containing protein [Pirellulaceae bacterium]|nr:CBS domain-containing protein [Pirellulaceae bacterium]
MSFKEELRREPISCLPMRDAIKVHTGTLLRAAIAQMRSKSLGCTVIVDYSGIPLGIFTEHSVIAVLQKNVTLDDRTVEEFADPGFFALKSSEPISRVWDAIERDEARFVCVTDDDGKLVGVTGQRGLAEYFADCFARVVTVQRLGSTPWMHQREGA